jgi:aspartyl aminopeptidase
MIVPKGKNKTVFKVKKGTATMVCTPKFLKHWLDRDFVIVGIMFLEEGESVIDLLDIKIPDNIIQD